MLYLPLNNHCVPKISLFLIPITTVFATNNTTFFSKYHYSHKYCCICDYRPHYFKTFVWRCESRAQRNNVKSHCGGRASSPTLSQCQLGDCQVHLASQAWLCVLGSLLVDIRLKLHLVHLAVKFSSALAAPLLWRTWLQSTPRAVSTGLAALDSANLKMDLAGLEPESVKSPPIHSAS